MYCKWVTVILGEDVECRVWVACTPSTTEDELQRRAIAILKNRLPEKKSGLQGLGDSLQAISDYEYSQGYGTRYEAEQSLKKLIEQWN